MATEGARIMVGRIGRIGRTVGGRWLTAGLLLSLGLSSGLGGMVVEGAPTQPGEAELDRIARGTAELRGLPVLTEIDARLLTREEALARIAEDIDQEYPAAVAEAESRTLAALGLLPAGTDLRAAYARYYERGVGGFYDPEADQLVVIDEDGELDAGAALTYSHEVVHALQDEHLGLDALDGDVGGRLTDAGLAVAALVEGDATVAGFAYLEAHPEWFQRGDDGRSALLELLRGMGAATATPAAGATPEAEPLLPLLRASFPFPYRYGRDFVERLREEDGWEAVNRAHEDPPRSTEQVMHPEKYVDARDDPAPLTLPDPTTAIGPDWLVVQEETLGEFLTAVVLASDGTERAEAVAFGPGRMPEPISNAAAGWGGDRYALWAGGDGEVLVWHSVWDSERDARAFALALLAREEVRWGGEHRGDSLDSVALAAGDGEVRLALSGREVYYVFASDPGLEERAFSSLRGQR